MGGARTGRAAVELLARCGVRDSPSPPLLLVAVGLGPPGGIEVGMPGGSLTVGVTEDLEIRLRGPIENLIR